MEPQPTAEDSSLTTGAEPSFADLSSESISQTLNRIRLTKIKAVEALSVAIRYFSRFPNAALSFAHLAADEAHHLAALTGRVIELDGTPTPNLSRSELLELLPGFKVDARGDLDAMVGFVSRLYVAQRAELLLSEETARCLECDKLTQRIMSRIARDERQHLASIRILLGWLESQGHSAQVSASLEDHVQSTVAQVSQ
jgi:bacterioferritin (cytochrome b1)